MARFLTLLAMTLALAGLCLGGTVTGFVSDEGCARSGAMANPECAKNCIDNGAAAVLVSENGTVYSIADQEKIKKFAGKMIAVTGKIEDEHIQSIEAAVLCKKSALCKG